MKVIIIKSNLKKALEAVSKISSEKSNLPILKNVLIKAENSKLYLITTNLEIGISYNCSAKIIESGQITVPLSLFSSIITNLTSEVINLSLSGNDFLINTDNYEAKLSTSSPDDFPLLPKIDDPEAIFNIKGDVLASSFNQVLSATQFSDLRPEINGVLFIFDGQNINLVGTDSFRLAEKIIFKDSFSCNIGENFNQSIIPLQSINSILRLISESDKVSVGFDNSQVFFSTPDFYIISRLLDGNFPDYKQIIPESFNVEFIIKKNDLIDALKVTNVLSSKVNDINLKVKGRIVELKSIQQGVGENRYILSGKIKKGDEISLNFNAGYFLQGVKAFNSGDVLIGLQDNEKPAMIRSESSVNDFSYIIMPIRT